MASAIPQTGSASVIGGSDALRSASPNERCEQVSPAIATTNTAHGCQDSSAVGSQWLKRTMHFFDDVNPL